MSLFSLFCSALVRPTKVLSLQSTPNFQPESFHRLRFAHRGGYAYGPENTLELIANNVRRRGVNAIEIDLQITRDGHLVLFHDEKVSRILDTVRDARVSELSLTELQAIPLRDQSMGLVYVAKFADFLDLMKQLIDVEGYPLMVEVDFKAGGPHAQFAVHRFMVDLHAAAQPMGGALLKHLFVSTFYPDVLAEIRKYSTDIVLAFSVNRDSALQVILSRLAAILAYFVVRKFDCAIIEPNSGWVTPAFVARWTRRGILINAFTANQSIDKRYLDRMGVAYATNCPEGTCLDDPTDQIGHKKRWCKTCFTENLAA